MHRALLLSVKLLSKTLTCTSLWQAKEYLHYPATQEEWFVRGQTTGTSQMYSDTLYMYMHVHMYMHPVIRELLVKPSQLCSLITQCMEESVTYSVGYMHVPSTVEVRLPGHGRVWCVKCVGMCGGTDAHTHTHMHTHRKLWFFDSFTHTQTHTQAHTHTHKHTLSLPKIELLSHLLLVSDTIQVKHISTNTIK